MNKYGLIMIPLALLIIGPMTIMEQGWKSGSVILIGYVAAALLIIKFQSWVRDRLNRRG